MATNLKEDKVMMGFTKLLQRISEKNKEGLELRRQSLQNGRMYHWILSKVLKMAEGQ